MSEMLGLMALLVGLELVLGIDNVLMISIVVSRLPEGERNRARVIGLALALVVRLLFVVGAMWLVHLTQPIVTGWNISWRDVVLVAGGLFLITKAVVEIHRVVELKDEKTAVHAASAFGMALVQIVLLDIVFSLDSVITAVGLTSHLFIIAFAVIVSFCIILLFAKPIGDFIIRRPTLKILALAFLLTIGITIVMEGMHEEVSKAYIYLPMGFALMVELLQMRHASNRRRMDGGE